VRKRDYVTMNVYWFGLAFMWNGLHPIVLPVLLLRFVPEALKNTYLGVLTFAGLLLAALVQPIAGGLSDSTRSRWGRRRPWMVGGALCALVFLGGIALATEFSALLLAYLLLQLASNSAHGPAHGLIPDLVASDRRGLASGIKNLFDMGGLVVVSLLAGQLMGSGNSTVAILAIGVIVLTSTVVTTVATPERPTIRARQPGAERGLRSLLHVNLRNHPDYVRLLVSRFLILLGIYAVQAFAQYYIGDWLHVQDAAQTTGNLMAVIGLALTVLVFPAGLLSDLVGRKLLNLLSGALAAAGVLLLIFVRDLTSLYLVGAVIGLASGIFLSVNWALATDLVPKAEAGKYLGISNLATAGAGAASRLGGPLIDHTNALFPGSYLGYPALFVLAAASTLIGTLLLLGVHEKPSDMSVRLVPLAELDQAGLGERDRDGPK